MGSAVSNVQQGKAPNPPCESPTEGKAKEQTPAAPQETSSAARADKAALKRQVGLGSAVALIIGSIIGSGIFVTPSSVFRNSGSIGVDLLVWIVCGILSITGGLCYAELATLLPTSGGDYAYLTAATKGLGRFGDVVPFLQMWCYSLVLDPMSAALQGLTFSSYALSIVYPTCQAPYETTVLVALSFTTLATAVNCFSVKTSARVQDIFSSIKCLILISVIITGAVFAFKVTDNHFQDEALFRKPESASRLVLAFYGALYSYGGWKQICLIAEEVTEPHKNILRATLIGILAVTAIYVLTNVAYFVVLDPNTFATSEAIAVSFTAATWGGNAAGIIPVAVSISTFGTLCAGFFSSARVILAASRQGHLAPVFSCITLHTSTPVAAIMLRGSLALAFTFIGSISYLIEGSVFLENVWEIVVLLCLFGLRHTMKDAHRPYAVPLPLAVVKFLVSVALVVIPLLRPVDCVQYVVILAMLVAGAVYYTVFVAFSCSVPGTKPLTRFIQKLLLSVPCTNDLEIMLKEKL
ncbi:b(0,+)-type amino acid transporter 1-like isoform X2 [Dermacentor andersoni]|uniref:b(0,+)-type amino acid transporter 1-like isoform X2 n=1 Tax=Dermacentor andersoni TaxID=34620 RepID=UPI0021552636|nr:b(0,+)-type amino acid transporter 1-like isoform X2 [Dermacentor andersoni]XP_054921275.1 b(0,+)-type amino acid transporter 1-like isoform X2 [Dermacentor andersoni]